MKVRSPLVTEMSGKLGNMVASTARGGITYFRALVTPRNPATLLQLALRAALVSAARYWKETLTESQQEAWWDVAEGGQTGQTLFQRVNQPRIYAVNAGLATPPFVVVTEPPETTSTPLTPPTSIVIDDSANTLTFTPSVDDQWNAETVDAGKVSGLFVYASHQQSASRFSRQHAYRIIGTLSRAEGDPTFNTAQVINLAPLGFTTQAGKVMYVKFVAQDQNGGVSIVFEQRVTITA